MVKLDNKLVNFSAANKRLHEAITTYKRDTGNSLYRDGLIQRFEFTFELAWKTLAEFLTLQGIDLPTTPKAVFKAAYASGYIQNEQIWVNILEDRNLMSHTYDMDLSVRIADDICLRYGKAMTDLLKTIKSYE